MSNNVDIEGNNNGSRRLAPLHIESYSREIDDANKENGSANLIPQLPNALSWTSWRPLSPEFGIRNVMLTSANHSVIHSPQKQRDGVKVNQLTSLGSSRIQGEPDLQHLDKILGALILTTLLVWLSALDAKNHCNSDGAYSVYDMTEDYDDGFDYNQNAESKLCSRMFMVIIVPVCAATLLLSAIAFWVLGRYNYNSALLDLIDKNFQTYLLLLVIHTIIMLVWTFGIVAIMLQPRYLENYDTGDNPYQSLAAVDSVGHVGDNANLYYTSWISMGLATALLYQTFIGVKRPYRLKKFARAKSSEYVENIEATLSSITKRQLAAYRASQETWYTSLYRLRKRTGTWLAALLSTIIVLVSSVTIWKEILVQAAEQILGMDNLSPRDVCGILSVSGPEVGVPAEMCARTSFAIISSLVAAILSAGAIVLHVLARKDAAQVMDELEESRGPILPSEYLSRGSNRLIPLRVEFIFSVVLSNALGLNAVLATGLQGPAAKVGNLYYASWFSFLLCLRIMLGCLEELVAYADHKKAKESSLKTKKLHAWVKSQYAAPALETEPRKDPDDESTATWKTATSNTLGDSTIGTTKNDNQVAKVGSFVPEDILEKMRSSRVRHYFFLSIFSTVCMASALDAAYNTVSDLTPHQNYMIICPALVAVISVVEFALCLTLKGYKVVSKFRVGGVLSLILFCLWFSNLMLNMNSESTWAVNAVGDIEIANLFYFSWASIVTSFIIMMSFWESILGIQKDDVMIGVWMAVNKVCFVILGAGIHIWQNIEDDCDLEELQSGAVTYCSKTVFAIAVGLTGMFVGSSVTASRVLERQFCPSFCSKRVRARVEAILSVFLVLLFAVAVAAITGIGGPGQSVGDLYYATWLAFIVAIGVFVHCYNQIKLDEMEEGESEHSTGGSKLGSIPLEASFVNMQ